MLLLREGHGKGTNLNRRGGGEQRGERHGRAGLNELLGAMLISLTLNVFNTGKAALVVRFRHLHPLAARSRANAGIKGPLAIL
jgi:hypothetical protein